MNKSILDELRKTGDVVLGLKAYFDLENSTSLAYFLNQIPDPRRKQGKQYSLLAVICLVIWGYMSSIGSIRKIQSKAVALEKMSHQICSILHIRRIPSHQTISRILNLINPEDLMQAFLNRINAHQEKTDYHLAIDGKSINAMTDKANGKKHPPYIINVVDCNTNQLVFHREIPDKRSEISVVPEVIRFLAQKHPDLIEGMTITTDALNTQIETIKACNEANVAFVSPLKKNHRNFLEEIQRYVRKFLKDHHSFDFHITESHEHGRMDKRIYVVIPVEYTQEGFEDIECICQVIRYRKEHSGTDRYTLTKTFYQSTVMLDANEFASLISSHWQVEVYHNFLDREQKEDQSTSKGNAFGNCSLLRKAALNLIFELFYGNSRQVYNQIADEFLYNFCSAMNMIFGL